MKPPCGIALKLHSFSPGEHKVSSVVASPVESNSNLAHLLYDLSKNLTSKISINALLIRLRSHLLTSSELNTIWCLFHKL